MKDKEMTMHPRLPKIQMVFCNGFFVVSRQETDEENCEHPTGHSRHNIVMFPWVIWFEIMKQFWNMKYKTPWRS